MKSRLAKRRCFVGASKVTETRKNGQTEPATFPFSLHRAERSRTIDKTPPPSAGWAPRNDNIPLLIAIIPLCYGAFWNPAQREHRCFHALHFVVLRQERQCWAEKIYNKFTCARAHKCAACMPSLDLSWLGISFGNRGTCPKYFSHLVARLCAKTSMSQLNNDVCCFVEIIIGIKILYISMKFNCECSIWVCTCVLLMHFFKFFFLCVWYQFIKMRSSL